MRRVANVLLCEGGVGDGGKVINALFNDIPMSHLTHTVYPVTSYAGMIF